MRVCIRTQVPLSRRDQMMVARQFTAWDLRGSETRPVGYGVTGLANGVSSPWVANKLWDAESDRSPRDGGVFGRIPGNKLPGYHHVVPTGQKFRFITLIPRRLGKVRYWKAKCPESGTSPARSAIQTQRRTPSLHHSITPHARIRGQPVRRSFRFMLKVGLASEARSTAGASAKAEGRRRGRERTLHPKLNQEPLCPKTTP